MNPIAFALRRPVTVVVATIGLIAGGVLAYQRMMKDIFPALNLPVIYVCQPYGGLDPSQIEGLIANYYEYHFLYINNIHHVESKNVQGVCLMKLFFHPGADMAQAMAETVGYVNRSRAFMPPGTVPPFITRFDTGSVPVGYLVLSSETKTLGQIQDQALFKVRPMFGAIPGVSAPPPFGGNQRTIVVRADPARLHAYGLSADRVVQALAAGNTISPSGSIRIGERMPMVPMNSLVVNPADLGTIEVKPGVFLRDVVRRDTSTDRPLIDDASDYPTGYALVNGKRAVYILVTKRASASTLAVIENVRKELPKMKAALPDDISVSFEFDQSPYVTNSMKNVALEGLLSAGLVGLMVLLFLRDWRTAIVVVLNIPLALTGSVAALYLTGQTLNLMTLGGLALAVGILVDEATVEVENIHAQLQNTDSVAVAVRRGNAETAVPRLLAMLCVLAAFAPVFVLQGSARALFMPLSLAVGFAMITSYILSSTLVPVLCVWLLRKHGSRHEARGESSLATAYRGLLNSISAVRWLLVPLYVALACGFVYLAGPWLGMEIFPRVDAGTFQFRVKAPTGTRIEQTEAITQEALRFIAKEVGEENVAITLGYVGVVPSSYPINSVYLWTGGPEEAVMRVALKRGAVRIEDLKAKLREKLPDHLRQWAKQKWTDEGLPAEVAAKRLADLKLSFEPADIVNEIMSFGSPTPIEVVVHSTKMAENRAHAEKIKAKLAEIPALRDLQFAQALDYPTVEISVDREKLALAGIDASTVAKSVAPFTSSSRFTVPNYWRDPATGISYQVQVEVPQALVANTKALESITVAARGDSVPLLLGDVGEVKEGTMPGEIHRYNTRRMVSMTANVAGEDLGRVAEKIAAAIASVGPPPQGVQVDIRGQIAPMNELFDGLELGLAVAIGAIFLLLTAYFQSVRLTVVAVAAIPAVLAGVVVALAVTGTTINLQSFMGAIMAVGVAVANAILLVTFAHRNHCNGMWAHEAAVDAAVHRARPILMTGFAMIAGMIPMALGMGEGGDQTAPLGRAVVGGLLASMIATLFILPAAFALLIGKRTHQNVSLDPFDAESRYFLPDGAPDHQGRS